MLYVGIALAILISLAIIGVGIRYLLAPVASAKTFGLPTWPEEFPAWLNLKGVRDIASGLVLLVPLALGEFHVVGWMMFAAAFTPLGDALTVLRYRGDKTLAYAMHGVTALVVVVTGVLLVLS